MPRADPPSPSAPGESAGRSAGDSAGEGWSVLADDTLTVAPTERSDRLVTASIALSGNEIGGLSLAVTGVDDVEADLSWSVDEAHRGLGHTARAVRLFVDWSLTDRASGGLGLHRVTARVPADERGDVRVATRAGFLQEGVERHVTPPADGGGSSTGDLVVLARLSSDVPLSDPSSFRSVLNAFLPRKRAIAQLLVRDESGRALLCQLTYKRDWDLPGGVVEVGESPRLAVVRELEEELGLTLEAGELLLTDWLPPWGGWDDAVCLVFDGGVLPSDVVSRIVKQEREISDAQFLTAAQVRERATDFTARRIEAALAGERRYTESGR